MSEPRPMPEWIGGMIAAMAAYVNSGCGEEEAARVGALVGDVGATLYYVEPNQ